MLNEFKDKAILVTGGTGSIGSEIVRQLLQYEPRTVRVYSRDETKQFELLNSLDNDRRVNLLIGDIRDKDRLNLAMENIQIVFHAAALKHVFSCERNPFEAVKTNVYGTQNVIDCALANKVEKVVGVSTDKAADPTNVLGCTKLLAEKIMLASYFYKGFKKTNLSLVRFGNVLFSRGSVIPLFIEQIKKGGPITITDERMVRFVMSTKEAVKLIFKATNLTSQNEIFILKMPAVRLVDLAQALINIYAPKFGVDKNKISFKIIGRKKGERINEKLLGNDEAEYVWETDDMFVITPFGNNDISENIKAAYPNIKKVELKEYGTLDQEKLSVKQIEDLLSKGGLPEFNQNFCV